MATDPEYDALYAAVCAAPEDDTPRLVLADWLDEHDDPDRAALIRAQIELARSRESDPHADAVLGGTAMTWDWSHYADPAAISPEVARLAELIKRVAGVQRKAEERWKAALGKRKAGRLGSCERGIPYHISVSNARQYVAAVAKGHSEKLPGYGLFLMRGNAANFEAFLASGQLAGARRFTLFGVTTADMVNKLGARPEVRNFRSLHLDLDTADPVALTALASQPNWGGLTALTVKTNLYGRGTEFDLPDYFFRGTHLRNLSYLSLGIRGLTGRGLAGLAQMGLTRLRRLDVHSNAIDETGGAPLAGGDFPELRSLDVGSNRLGNAGAAALARTRKLANLAALDLGGNDVTDPETMAALIAGPAFPVLAALSLRDNRARELDPAALAAPGRGPTLRLLSLRHCSLSAKAAAALATAPALAGLVALDLAGNEIGDAGALAVARAPWENLTCLDLGENGITAAGVKALAAWPGLAKLAYFDLGGNPIGPEGARALAACKALKKCRKIVVPHNDALLPADGLALLRTAFGRRIDY